MPLELCMYHSCKKNSSNTRFQIKTQRIFSVVRFLCALRKCRLSIQNLDAFVIILKTWPIDAFFITFKIWPVDIRDECNFIAKSNLGEFFY